MPSLPLASPALQRRLHLGDTGDANAADLRDNLSGLAGRDSWLWLAGDEGRSLHRLQADASGGYGHSSRVKLADYGLAGGKDDGESDLEGLTLDGQRLWLVGSHSLRRRRHDSDKGEPLLRPFLPILSKDNGLDIEGITARGDRVLLGLLGPVLRGIALVAELRLVVLGWGGRAQGLDGIAAAVTLVVNGSHGQRRQTLFTAPGVEKNCSESETQGASNGSYSQG